jgi:hypothetical protein
MSEIRAFQIIQVKPALASTEHARKYLGGISRAGLYNLLDANELQSVKIGGRRMVLVDSMDALITRNRESREPWTGNDLAPAPLTGTCQAHHDCQPSGGAFAVHAPASLALGRPPSNPQPARRHRSRQQGRADRPDADHQPSPEPDHHDAGSEGPATAWD